MSEIAIQKDIIELEEKKSSKVSSFAILSGVLLVAVLVLLKLNVVANQEIEMLQQANKTYASESIKLKSEIATLNTKVSVLTAQVEASKIANKSIVETIQDKARGIYEDVKNSF